LNSSGIPAIFDLVLCEMTLFALALFSVAILSGATATIVGFGIGSLLTPLLAMEIGLGPAVAAVALPHAIATAIRCWRLRAEVNARVLRSFGLVSAVGGLAGALAYAQLGNQTLTLALGGLLLLTAIAGLTGLVARWHPRGNGVWLLGLTSGFFGGIAGNQGGLRSGAMLVFSLAPREFIATATATGLLVDMARMPVYFWRAGNELWAMPHLVEWLLLTIAGVTIGTIVGERILFRMPPERFRRVVSAFIGLLGLWLLGQAIEHWQK
jgi:uncharacterized protein